LKKIFILILILICYLQNSKGDEVFNLFEKAKKNLQFQENIYLNQEYYNKNKEFIKRSRFLNLNSNISFYDKKANLNLYLDIDIFNRNHYDLKINNYEEMKSEFLIKKEEQELFKNVLELYVSLLIYKELIKVQENNINWIKEILKFLENDAKNDSSKSIEINKWKIKLLEEEKKLVNYEENKNLAEKNIKILCGIDEINLKEIPLFPDLEEIKNLENQIIEKNPELNILKLDKNISQTAYQKEKDYWLPKFSISYKYQFDPYSDENKTKQSINLSLDFKLYSFSHKYNLINIKLKEKNIDIFLKREKIKLLQILNALYSYINSDLKSLNLIEEKYKSMKEMLDIYQKEYKMKNIDFILLDNYNKEFLLTEESYIQTKYKIYYNYILLKYLANYEKF